MLKLFKKKMDYESSDELDYNECSNRINQIKYNDRCKLDDSSENYYKPMTFSDPQNEQNDKNININDNEIENYKNQIRYMILSEKFENFDKDHINKIILIMTNALKKTNENWQKKKVEEILKNISTLLENFYR